MRFAQVAHARRRGRTAADSGSAVCSSDSVPGLVPLSRWHDEHAKPRARETAAPDPRGRAPSGLRFPAAGGGHSRRWPARHRSFGARGRTLVHQRTADDGDAEHRCNCRCDDEAARNASVGHGSSCDARRPAGGRHVSSYCLTRAANPCFGASMSRRNPGRRPPRDREDRRERERADHDQRTDHWPSPANNERT